jgi:Type IV secretion system proteins
MKKTTTSAAVAVAAALVLAAPPAKAVFCSNCTQEGTEMMRHMESVKQWVSQLRQMEMQYRQLESTYAAIAHSTDLSSIASALGGVSRTYMPEASGVVDALGAGSRALGGGMGGGINGLLGRADAMLNAGRRYMPQQRDAWVEEMERREVITANARALAADGLADAQGRVRNLEMLRARLEAAQDGTEVGAVQGLIAVEQQGLDAHRTQIEQVRLMLASSDREERQRGEQLRRESADIHAESTRWAVDALGASSPSAVRSGGGW